MNSFPIIEKASGEMEAFNPDKLRGSLQKANTPAALTEEIVSQILSEVKPGMTTQEIYRKAFQMLRHRKRSNAARYSLKKAIMELGPTGYPFEQFIGQVFLDQGFDIQVGQVLQGKCVTHEMDVIATLNSTQYLVECKFYNSAGKNASVQVPLYVRSRVNDIIDFRKNLPEYNDTHFIGWVVTNNRFTDDALTYGRCAGLHMLSWDLPKEKSLKDMVEKARLFPVTALTSLNGRQKRLLLEKDIVLCRQLQQNIQVLDEIGFAASGRAKIKKELDELCNTSKKDEPA